VLRPQGAGQELLAEQRQVVPDWEDLRLSVEVVSVSHLVGTSRYSKRCVLDGLKVVHC
jgi:hypothetical protein